MLHWFAAHKIIAGCCIAGACYFGGRHFLHGRHGVDRYGHRSGRGEHFERGRPHHI